MFNCGIQEMSMSQQYCSVSGVEARREIRNELCIYSARSSASYHVTAVWQNHNQSE